MMTSDKPAGLNARETKGASNPTVGTFEAVYKTPFLAHACMEVLNCTVPVTRTHGSITGVELWVPTQGQSFIRGTVKSVPGLTGLTDAQIKVNSMLCGGGFGRKIEKDYVLQAVKIAVAVGKPVKLTWSRPQDFKNDKYRPCALMRVRFGADVNGIQGLVYRNISASITVQHGGNAGGYRCRRRRGGPALRHPQPADRVRAAARPTFRWATGARWASPTTPSPSRAPSTNWR